MTLNDASDVKEVDFFSYHYENGFRWYESQFIGQSGTREIGEISPSYFHEVAASERAHAYAPNLKIVVSLRDPIERALSQHRHMARLGFIPTDDLSFETALASNPTYLDQGFYHRHLVRWMDAFGTSNVHVILMEDIKLGSQAVAQALFRFLAIDETHHPDALEKKSNTSYFVKSQRIDRTVATLRKSLTTIVIGPAWKCLGDSGLRRVYHALNRRESGSVIPEPKPETLLSLRHAFQDDVLRLSTLLGRDLSGWMPTS